MLKEKRKQKPNRRKHRLISLMLIVFLLLTAIFPPRLLGDFYQYNGLFLGLLGVGIVAYALWAFFVQRIRLVAVLLIALTFAWGYIQWQEINKTVYSNGWCTPIFANIGDFPLGIQTGCLFTFDLF